MTKNKRKENSAAELDFRLKIFLKAVDTYTEPPFEFEHSRLCEVAVIKQYRWLFNMFTDEELELFEEVFHEDKTL
jgi:hypothetical protein